MGSDDSSSDGGKQKVDLKSLLSTPALSMGAGSVTDTGFNWTLPTQVENPIVLSAGIPDMDPTALLGPPGGGKKVQRVAAGTKSRQKGKRKNARKARKKNRKR